MNRNNYRMISQLGSNMRTPSDDPLTYCLNTEMENGFLHGGSADTMGQHGKACQRFMSDYCANNWDQACEISSQNKNNMYPNSDAPCGTSSMNLNAGQMLIRNTASKKYLVGMSGNCQQRWEPFDPNVASSPMVSYWSSPDGSPCVPMYSINPATINSDPVINKLINNPNIAPNVLSNIYHNLQRQGKMSALQGTRLGQFYQSPQFALNQRAQTGI